MILTSTDLDFDRFTLDNPLEETNLDFFRVRIPSCLSSRRLSIMYFLVTIINYNVVYILKYKRKFNESPIKKYLKVFLSIYLRIITYKSFMLNLYLVRNDLLTKFLFFINSIKFMSIIDKLSWLELNVYENLHRISTILRKINKSSSNKDTILCYWILAHIGSEKQLEGEESIMNFLIESIFENFKDYVENNPNNREFEVSYFNQKLTIKNLVDCLRRLCLIKRLKEFVYFDQEFFLIKSIFFNSLTDVETKISILKLYIQLGLNNIKVFQHLASDNELKDFVVKLSLILNKNIDAELAKACQALLWLLNEKDKNISLKSNINLSLIEQSTSSENIKNELKIILIYDSLTNQGFAVVLEDSLNQSNFHISRIYEKNDSKTNSYLERIKSIEKCNVVLICLSEGFRLNEYCQLEATYACEMNKALIVLSLDGCFSSNGEYFDFEGSWLERVLTQKIRVDFVQNSFNLGIKILIEKLNSIKRNRSNEIHNLPIKSITYIRNNTSATVNVMENLALRRPPPQTPSTKSANDSKNENDDENESMLSSKRSVIEWNKKEVYQWLAYMKINEELIQAYRDINGIILNQMYRIKLLSPNFFYNRLVIETKNRIKLSDIAYFSDCLDNLFYVDEL